MANKKPSTLNDRQKLFVKFYVTEFNATKSAIAAGYSKDTAYSIGQRLLKNVEIQAAIEAAKAKIVKKIEITQERIAEELAKVAFSDIKDYVEFGPNKLKIKQDKDVDGACIQEVSSHTGNRGVSTKLKLYDKMKALELLGRYKGMYKDVIVTPPQPQKLSLDELEELEKEEEQLEKAQENKE